MKGLLKKLRGKAGRITISNVIVAAVALLVVGVLAPIAIGTISNTTTTNWNSSVVTIFQVLLPIVAVVGIAIAFIPKAYSD